MSKIRLVFLCTSLEPGQDGVGDYTRQLAAELIRQGYQAGIVALKDKTVTTELKAVQTADTIEIPVLRIPALWPSKQRFRRAKEWIDKMNPDWLSIQYVPFGFHSKGLPFMLETSLKELGIDRKWHIMFHELWVGMEKETTLKYWLWGTIQRFLIQRLVTVIKPNCVNSHSETYLIYLKKMGIPGIKLPLFANIPDLLKDLKKESRLCLNTEIRMVIFGAVHPNVPVISFVDELVCYSRKNMINISLSIVGRPSDEQKRWASICKEAGFEVREHGEQSAEQVSKILSQATIGISTTPCAIIEKSGTVAAMQEHGLPVVCVSRPWSPRGIEAPIYHSGVIEYSLGNIEDCMQYSTSGTFTRSLIEVTSQFVFTLQSS